MPAPTSWQNIFNLALKRLHGRTVRHAFGVSHAHPQHTQAAFGHSYAAATQRIRATLEKDKEYMAVAAPILFGDDKETVRGENGDKLGRLFTSWRDDNAPSITSILLAASEHHRIDPEHPIFQAALLTSVAAEIPLDNAYHNTAHFREVTAMAVRLSSVHNILAVSGDAALPLLKHNDMSKLLLAAAGHDLEHDGKGNGTGEAHIPFKLEPRSLDAMVPFMHAAGMDTQDIKDVHTIVYVTDVSGAESPHWQLKKLSAAAQSGQSLEMIVVDHKLFDLKKDPKLLVLASIMSDADLGPTAGTHYDFNQRMARNISCEKPHIIPGPQDTLDFMNIILGNQFTSFAGKKVLGSSIETLRSTAEEKMTPSQRVIGKTTPKP